MGLWDSINDMCWPLLDALHLGIGAERLQGPGQVGGRDLHHMDAQRGDRGLLGRAVAQGIYWGTRPLDRAAQELSRYREQARLRKDARLAARKAAGQDAGQAAAE